MKTKLTLALDEAVIKKAKKYAKDNNTSLSALLENYLRLLVSREKHSKVEEPVSNYSSIEEFRGILKVKNPKTFDYKKEKAEYLWEKYKKLK